MRTPWLDQIGMIPWYLFCVYWAITALRVKRTKATERSSDRIATILVMVAGFVLLFDANVRAGWLDSRFAPAEEWLTWSGIVLTYAGVAFAVWARYCIGEYWSGRVTLKQGHRLIRSGPYRLVRHPIYTGLLIAVIGRALILGEWRGWLGVLLVLVTHARKAQREETLLISEFGDEYAGYRRVTGFLFPRFSRSA
jgi:protein-S-isoprenylcysteine O-methyltransferase Ste14